MLTVWDNGIGALKKTPWDYMNITAPQITDNSAVYSTACLGQKQIKQQNPAIP